MRESLRSTKRHCRDCEHPTDLRELRALAGESFGADRQTEQSKTNNAFNDIHDRNRVYCNMVKPIERLVSLG